MTDLECVLLLRRRHVDRRRVLSQLVESLDGIVRAAGPAAVAGARGVLDGAEEAADGVAGRGGRHGAGREVRVEREEAGGPLAYVGAWVGMEATRNGCVKEVRDQLDNPKRFHVAEGGGVSPGGGGRWSETQPLFGPRISSRTTTST